MYVFGKVGFVFVGVVLILGGVVVCLLLLVINVVMFVFFYVKIEGVVYVNIDNLC